MILTHSDCISYWLIIIHLYTHQYLSSSQNYLNTPVFYYFLLVKMVKSSVNHTHDTSKAVATAEWLGDVLQHLAEPTVRPSKSTNSDLVVVRCSFKSLFTLFMDGVSDIASLIFRGWNHVKSSRSPCSFHHQLRLFQDLLELYCGCGSHTVALAPFFRQVLAVEINRHLVDAAQ